MLPVTKSIIYKDIKNAVLEIEKNSVIDKNMHIIYTN